MRALFIFTCLFGLMHFTHSQSFLIEDLNSLHDLYTFEKTRKDFIDPDQYTRFKGSPFLSEDFVEGEVVINDTINFEKVPMRYNIFTGFIEYLDAREKILAVNMRGREFTFNFGNHYFKLKNYKKRKSNERGLLELVVDGKIKLYREYNVEFKGKVNPIGYKDAQPNRFIRKDDVYLLSIDNNTPEAFFTKKELIRKLEAEKLDINEYLNHNKLKVRSEESLISIIEYSNGL